MAVTDAVKPVTIGGNVNFLSAFLRSSLRASPLTDHTSTAVLSATLPGENTLYLIPVLKVEYELLFT